MEFQIVLIRWMIYRMSHRILNHLCSISEGIENRVDSRLEGSLDGKFRKATNRERRNVKQVGGDVFSPHVSLQGRCGN